MGRFLRRSIGAAGLALVKEFEGCELVAYRCPAGVWTIGYGSTGKHVRPGLIITPQRAEELLREDLLRFENAVADHAPGANDNQFDAMVCFAFNVGTEAFSTSTLLRLHKAGNFAGAAAQFARWNRASGKVLAGLTRRRAAEARLYAA